MAASTFSGPIISLAGFVTGSAGGGGLISGNGPPTGVTANKGTLYSNLTGTTTVTRLYINTDGGTTWTNFTSVA
jgi:hypothetical protein